MEKEIRQWNAINLDIKNKRKEEKKNENIGYQECCKQINQMIVIYSSYINRLNKNQSKKRRREEKWLNYRKIIQRR